MKNKQIIIAVIALLVVAIGAYFFLAQKKGTNPIANLTGEGSSPKTIKELLLANVPQKCTFSSTFEDGGSTEGVVYTSGGKVRGDFSSTAEGKTYKSHMIVEGNTSYMWTDEEKQGYKITNDESETTETDSSEGAETNTAVDINETYDYKCTPWVADSSVFDLPGDVSFTDMSTFMNPSIAPSSDDANGQEVSDQCSACDYLSGESKTQCLEALNCQ